MGITQPGKFSTNYTKMTNKTNLSKKTDENYVTLRNSSNGNNNNKNKQHSKWMNNDNDTLREHVTLGSSSNENIENISKKKYCYTKIYANDLVTTCNCLLTTTFGDIKHISVNIHFNNSYVYFQKCNFNLTFLTMSRICDNALYFHFAKSHFYKFCLHINQKCYLSETINGIKVVNVFDIHKNIQYINIIKNVY